MFLQFCLGHRHLHVPCVLEVYCGTISDLTSANSKFTVTTAVSCVSKIFFFICQHFTGSDPHYQQSGLSVISPCKRPLVDARVKGENWQGHPAGALPSSGFSCCQ